MARKIKRTIKSKAATGEEFTLPEAPKPVDTNLQHYTTLVYGREKWGKTTFFSSYPETIFLMTEPGAQGLSIFEFNHEQGGIRNWNDFRAAVDLLEQSKRFKNVVIDTAARAYDMCMDWVCEELNISYPGTDEYGVQDRGKSWKFIKREFMDQIHRLKRTGRGVCFTGHSKSEHHKSRTGEEYDRVYPDMSGQCRSVVQALVDMFFYGEYFKDEQNRTVRCIVTEGDEMIWAGHRPIAGFGKLPQFIQIKEGVGYETLLGAFKGTVKGYNALQLGKARESDPATQEFLIGQRKERGKEGVKSGKKVVRRVVKQ